MSGFMAAAVEREAAPSDGLRELARGTVEIKRDGKTVETRVLAVAEASDGALVLCREVEKARKDKDGAPVKDKAGEPVKDKVLKRTPALADFAHAQSAKRADGTALL